MKSSISNRAIVLLYGLSIIAAQTIVFRAVLLGGSFNELTLAVAFCLWLLWAAMGSLLGNKVYGVKRLVAVIFGLILSLWIALFMGYFSTILFGKPMGVKLGPLELLFVLIIAIAPCGFLSGMTFPVIVNTLSIRASSVYAIESLGAALGGLTITLVFSMGLTSEIALMIVLIFMCLMVYVLGYQRIVIGIVGLGLVILWVFIKLQPLRIQDGYRLIKRTDSQYAEVLLAGSASQRVLYYGGHLYWSYPSAKEAELPVHVVLGIIERPRKVLLIGGNPGLIEEVLKYKPDVVYYIEPDKKVITLTKETLLEATGGILSNRDVKFISGSVAGFLDEIRSIDVIISSIPPPETAQANRFFTVEFFRKLYRSLTDKGIVVFRLVGSTGYIMDSMIMVDGSLVKTAKSVFPYVYVTNPEYALAIASKSSILFSLGKYKKRLPPILKFFYPELIKDLFFSLKTEEFKRLLADANVPVNSISRPIAYLFNLSLWAERAGSAFMATLLKDPYSVYILIALVVGIFFIKLRQTPFRFILFTTGAWSMGVVMMIILLYQSLYGLVYERLGLLSGLFMLGLFLGIRISGIVPTSFTRKALLGNILVAMVAVFVGCFLESQISFYVFCIVAGIITAVEYNLCLSYVKTEGAILYGMELLGSSMSAIFIGVFLLPLQGLYMTAAVLAGLKTLAAVMLINSPRI